MIMKRITAYISDREWEKIISLLPWPDTIPIMILPWQWEDLQRITIGSMQDIQTMVNLIFEDSKHE